MNPINDCDNIGILAGIIKSIILLSGGFCSDDGLINGLVKLIGDRAQFFLGDMINMSPQ